MLTRWKPHAMSAQRPRKPSSPPAAGCCDWEFRLKAWMISTRLISRRWSMTEVTLQQQVKADEREITRKPTREGSPWTGMWSVILKEMADHLSSTRILILDILIVLAALGTIYSATQDFPQAVGQDQFVYLRLFTIAHQPLPTFVALLGFFIPLV